MRRTAQGVLGTCVGWAALLLAAVAWSQTGQSAMFAQLFTKQGSTGQSPVFVNVANLGINNHVVQWTTQGGPSACTLVVQSSLDAVTWSTVATQTCTTLGSVSFTGTYVYLTVNLTALSGGSTPNISANYHGYLPGQGLPVTPAEGGSGTTTPFTPGSIVFVTTNGVYQQDNALFFWDDVNHRLCLLSNTCLNTIDVGGGKFYVTSAGNVAGVNGTYTGAVQGATGAITTVDGLTEGGRIVPSYFYEVYRQTAGETPATATVWTAPEDCELIAMTMRQNVAGTDSGAVTLSAAKDPTGTAPGAGTGLLTATLNLKGTINANQAAALTTNATFLTFAAGDGLSLIFTGTMTAVAGVSVTFKFQRMP